MTKKDYQIALETHPDLAGSFNSTSQDSRNTAFYVNITNIINEKIASHLLDLEITDASTKIKSLVDGKGKRQQNIRAILLKNMEKDTKINLLADEKIISLNTIQRIWAEPNGKITQFVFNALNLFLKIGNTIQQPATSNAIDIAPLVGCYLGYYKDSADVEKAILRNFLVINSQSTVTLYTHPKDEGNMKVYNGSLNIHSATDGELTINFHYEGKATPDIVIMSNLIDELTFGHGKIETLSCLAMYQTRKRGIEATKYLLWRDKDVEISTQATLKQIEYIEERIKGTQEIADSIKNFFYRGSDRTYNKLSEDKTCRGFEDFEKTFNHKDSSLSLYGAKIENLTGNYQGYYYAVPDGKVRKIALKINKIGKVEARSQVYTYPSGILSVSHEKRISMTFYNIENGDKTECSSYLSYLSGEHPLQVILFPTMYYPTNNGIAITTILLFRTNSEWKTLYDEVHNKSLIWKDTDDLANTFFTKHNQTSFLCYKTCAWIELKEFEEYLSQM